MAKTRWGDRWGRPHDPWGRPCSHNERTARDEPRSNAQARAILSIRRVPIAGLFSCAGLLIASTASAGPVPVEESEGAQREPQPAATVSSRDRAQTPVQSSAGETGGLGNLYYELQLLQDEVRRLHGIVEEQNHHIERLTREHRERYIELDQRILELGRGGPVSPGDTPLAGGDPTGAGAPEVPAGPVEMTEREAYNAAISLVVQARPLPPTERRPVYQRAHGMFQDLIKEYPNGEFAANAFYWIGEIQLALEEPELARQAFVQVVLLYGEHPKVPDALYKLGEVYGVLGDMERAREYLERVIREHPTSTAAGLANTYLSELP